MKKEEKKLFLNPFREFFLCFSQKYGDCDVLCSCKRTCYIVGDGVLDECRFVKEELLLNCCS